MNTTLKYGVRTAAAATVLTAVTFIILHCCMQTLGPLDWLILPGTFLVWILIWGDNATGTIFENLIYLLACLLMNGGIGFLIGALTGFITTKCTQLKT